jgi:hypothetical protein
MKTGIELIAEERQKQIAKWGNTEAHDVIHDSFELSRAAAAISYNAPEDINTLIYAPDWAWELRVKYVNDNIKRLQIAGALIAAEIDRIQSLKQ